MPSVFEIADWLEEFALLLELKGENLFRLRAYQGAANSLRQSGLEVGELLAKAQNRQPLLPGVGAQIAQDIAEIATTGHWMALSQLRAQFPASLFELFELPGLGPKRVKILYEQLKITSIADLENACNDQRIGQVKGFGEKTIANLTLAIEEFKVNRPLMLLDQAWALYDEISAQLLAKGICRKVYPVGELQRSEEVISCLELLLVDAPGESLVTEIQKILPNAAVTPCSFGACALVDYRTLNFHVCAKSNIDSNPLYITYQNFSQNNAASDLISSEDILGILHAHSNYSDGNCSLRELALHVASQGYQYLGISDHSQSAQYANGLTAERVKRQWEEIEQLNHELSPFRILKGIESDILADGSLDYQDSILEGFDFVIISLHSQLQMPRREMMRRLQRAFAHPAASIVGHISTRLLLKRPGIDVDLLEVLELAAEHNLAMEINANPRRLDLPWAYHQHSLRLGVPNPICPDAHSREQLSYLRYGIAMARKGGLPAANVLNTKSLPEILSYLVRQKKKKAL